MAASNEHNEYGLVIPERPQPFRSPNSDVICVCDRGNVDFRVMERGFPEGDDVGVQIRADADSLGRCFPDVPFIDISLPLVWWTAYSVVALRADL